MDGGREKKGMEGKGKGKEAKGEGEGMKFREDSWVTGYRGVDADAWRGQLFQWFGTGRRTDDTDMQWLRDSSSQAASATQLGASAQHVCHYRPFNVILEHYTVYCSG